MEKIDLNYLRNLKFEYEFVTDLKYQTPSSFSKEYKLHAKAKEYLIANKKGVLFYFLSTIEFLEDQKTDISNSFYLNKIKNIEKNSLPSEINSRKKKLIKRIGKKYRQNNSDYRNLSEKNFAYSFGKSSSIRTCIGLYQTLPIGWKAMDGVLKILSFKNEAKEWIIYRELFKQLKEGSIKCENLSNTQNKVIRPSLRELVGSEEALRAVKNYLINEEIVKNDVNENLVWTGPTNDGEFKPIESLIHFGIFLKIELASKRLKNREIIHALNKEFKIRIPESNFSKRLRSVKAGGTQLENEYQGLFKNMKPLFIK